MNAVYKLSESTTVTNACSSLNMPRASFYRSMAPQVNNSSNKTNKTNAIALSASEKEHILNTLNSERFMDKTPYEIWATLLDEQTYLCSIRSMYRILHECNEVKERRRGHKQRNYSKPELLANEPNKVWSWDITKLKADTKWNYYYLYVIMDIYSRYVTGWMVASRETAVLAKDFLQETIEKYNINANQLTIHADRGASMKSKTVAQLLADMNVMKSHNRPYVSNDNPFSEANFKTLKYRPEFPGEFGSMQDANNFCNNFFQWYNNEQYHTGIALLTPKIVHFKQEEIVLKNRNEALNKAFNKTPQRFRYIKPTHQNIPKEVWINKPKNDTEENNINKKDLDSKL